MRIAPRKHSHIVFVSSSLGGGGAERVLLTMAGEWGRLGRTCTIVTLRQDCVREYEVPSGITVIRLRIIDETNPFWSFAQLRRLVLLRSAIVSLKPDVVISFIDKLNIAVLIALIGSRIPVVATEHLAPWMNPLGIQWEFLRRLTYSCAQAVVSPTDPISQWFALKSVGTFLTLPYPPPHYEVVPPVSRQKVVLAVGRLVPQKGFDLLIRAFESIASRFPDWSIEIAGEGPERAALAGQISQLNLQSKVHLLGHVTNLTSYYRRAEIFALSSRHEAFPMVLFEAINSGCCILASDCPTGPREILGSSLSGMLVKSDDWRELSKGLEELLSKACLRERLRAGASMRLSGFSTRKIMHTWDQVVFGAAVDCL